MIITSQEMEIYIKLCGWGVGYLGDGTKYWHPPNAHDWTWYSISAAYTHQMRLDGFKIDNT